MMIKLRPTNKFLWYSQRKYKNVKMGQKKRQNKVNPEITFVIFMNNKRSIFKLLFSSDTKLFSVT